MTFSIKYENIILITEKYFKNKYNYNLLKINSNNEFKPISVKKYNEIIEDIKNYFSELISIYLNNQKNKQIIIDNNNNIMYESNIFTINYIDKMMILLFISFILELLNFYIIHCEIYNIINFKKVIIKPSIDINTKIYDNKLINNLTNGFYFIINNFYIYINNIINNFINYFINTLFIKYNININEIEDCFIYKKENYYNENNKFLIIYDNWKIRLSNLLKISNDKIDNILYYCLKNLSNNINNDNNTNYSNRYGFFEIIYLNNKSYGNSFTYTVIEQYILLKLYYDPYKINIILQANNNELNNNELNNNMMYYTEIGLYDNLNKSQINLSNFSHWASNYYIYNDDQKLISYKLRILNKNNNNYSFSIASNKEYYFKSLLYIIIDINLHNLNIKNNFLNSHFNNIFNFFEYKFKNNLEKNNNYNSFKIYELINYYTNCNDILYNCNIDDIKLINDNINKININDCIDIKDMIINTLNPFKIIDEDTLNNITLYIDTYKDVIEDDKEVYKSIVTKFVNNNFYSTPKTSYHFYKLINTTVNNALNEYCKHKNINNKSIIFIFKGGNILRIIVEQILENNFNNYQMEEINKLKNTNFKRSDSDFQIYIKNLIGTKFLNSDVIITKEIMDDIYNDICNLSYLILNRIRNIILLDISKYIYFYQLNNKIQSELLTKLLNELNEVEDNINFTCLKFEDFIIGDNDLNNFPFISNNNDNINTYDNINSRNDFAILELSKEDELKISKNFKKLPTLDKNKKRLYLTDINYLHKRSSIYQEQNDNILEKKLIYKYRNKTNYFISLNNSLNLVKNNVNFKFNLIRMKLNITSYYTKKNNSDNKYYTNIYNLPGEFIDIVIPKYDNDSTEHFFKSMEDGDESITDYQISLENEEDINIKSYSITYFIKELELMLFYELPWFLVKYEKRLERLLLLYIIMFIQSFIKNNKYHKYYNKIIAYKNILSNIDNIDIDNINTLIKQKIKDEHNELLDILFSVYIIKINSIVKENSNELNNLITFYKVIYKYIEILEKTFNKINVKQFNTANKLEYYDKYLKYKYKYNNNK